MNTYLVVTRTGGAESAFSGNLKGMPTAGRCAATGPEAAAARVARVDVGRIEPCRYYKEDSLWIFEVLDEAGEQTGLHLAVWLDF